jgi:hypothetical protein
MLPYQNLDYQLKQCAYNTPWINLPNEIVA